MTAAAVPQPGGLDQAERLRALVRSLDATRDSVAAPVAAPEFTRPPIIAVASGKGGVGKTNICVSLSACLAGDGVRTALIDADIGMADADVLCGLRPTARLDRAIGEGDTTLWDLAVRAPGGFWLIPGATGVADLARTTESQRAAVLDQIDSLAGDTDAVLIDLAAGMGPEVTGFLDAADVALIVCTPEPTSIVDAYALLKCLATRDWPEDGRAEPPRLGLVVNQASHEAEARAVHKRVSGAVQRFLGVGLPLAGWVRSDRAVHRAVLARQPFAVVSPRRPASRDVHLLAQRLRDSIIEPVISRRLTARAQALLAAGR